jgi:hypothetical protein
VSDRFRAEVALEEDTSVAALGGFWAQATLIAIDEMARIKQVYFYSSIPLKTTI